MRVRTRATGARAANIGADDALTNDVVTGALVIADAGEAVAANPGEGVAADAGEADAADAGEGVAADAGEADAADAGEGVAADAGESAAAGEAVEGERVAGDRLKWGPYRGLEAIRAVLEEAHAKITSWKSNFFQMPRNATGKEAIKEMTRLLNLFNNKTAWEPVAIHLLIVFITLMLQKPAKTSKMKQNTAYLKKRLDLWRDGSLSAIMSECEEVQRRMQSRSQKQEKESTMRGFSRLMMAGKVRQALKLVDADSEVTGVHAMNDEIRGVLQRKHPEAEPAQQIAMSLSEVPTVENVIFEEINAAMVIKSAEETSGAGGPTRLDAESWKHILCSKVFGKVSEEFAEAVAVTARRLCSEDIPHVYLRLLWDCRLVPLAKEDNGVRPVGIGETLRRIIGKCVLKVTGGDVQQAPCKRAPE